MLNARKEVMKVIPEFLYYIVIALMYVLLAVSHFGG